MPRARKIQRFLSQPNFVAEQFTGTPGEYVKLEDTIKGFQEIIDGKHDELPEQAFYMVGTIEGAVAKARTLAGEDERRGRRPSPSRNLSAAGRRRGCDHDEHACGMGGLHGNRVRRARKAHRTFLGLARDA